MDSKVIALIRWNGELKENDTSPQNRVTWFWRYVKMHYYYIIHWTESVELLEDWLIRTDTLNKRLQSRILDLETRSMRNNIIFNFDLKSSDFGTEAEGENIVY